MADFDPPFANANSTKRMPNSDEIDNGFGCGPADLDLFNGLMNAYYRELGAIILEAGNTPSNDSFRQVIDAMLKLFPRVSPTTTLYVRTDGNDANDGSANDAAHAFATIAATVAYGTSRLFLVGRTLTIQLGNAGTYAPPGGLNCGTAAVIVRGDPANQANYLISGIGPSGGGSALVASVAGALQLNGVTVRNTDVINSNVGASGGGATLAIQNVSLQTTIAGNGALVLAGAGGAVNILSGCIFQGSAQYGLFAQANGLITISANMTFSSGPTFSGATAAVSMNSTIATTGSFTVSGSATGTRYICTLNGVINTSGGGGNYFPGSVAGTTNTGGQYA